MEGVATQPAEESEPGPDRGVAKGRVAIGAPAIGKEVTARDRDEAGIGGHQVAMAILGHKRHLDRVSDAILERRSGVARVARIFTPNCAQPGFHRVTHG